MMASPEKISVNRTDERIPPDMEPSDSQRASSETLADIDDEEKARTIAEKDRRSSRKQASNSIIII